MRTWRELSDDELHAVLTAKLNVDPTRMPNPDENAQLVTTWVMRRYEPTIAEFLDGFFGEDRFE